MNFQVYRLVVGCVSEGFVRTLLCYGCDIIDCKVWRIPQRKQAPRSYTAPLCSQGTNMMPIRYQLLDLYEYDHINRLTGLFTRTLYGVV